VKKALKLNRKGLREVIKKERKIRNFYQQKLESLEALKSEIQKKCEESEMKIKELTETMEEKIDVQDKSAAERCKMLFERSKQQRKSTLERSTNMAWEKMLLSDNRRSDLNCRVQESVRKLPMFNECHWMLQSANDDVKSLLSHIVLSSITGSGGSIEFSVDDNEVVVVNGRREVHNERYEWLLHDQRLFIGYSGGNAVFGVTMARL
jgi:exonuclease VII large subunit